MQEHCRLGDFSLTQFLISAVEHDIGYPEAKNFVGLLKQFVSEGIALVEVLSHSDELCTLTGKNKCFHLFTLVEFY